MKIIDVSLYLNNETVIYPGNVPLEVSIHHKLGEHATQLSKIVMGSHTGTHIDAPAHVKEGALAADQISLETLVGKARVLDFSKEESEAVTKAFLEQKNIKEGERILFKTKNSLRGFKEFYEDYIYVHSEAAEYLKSKKIALIGIDSLSIKKKGSTDHRPHTEFLLANIPILEGLDLKDAEEKEYELYFLPLKFTGLDGAPARAILIERE